MIGELHPQDLDNLTALLIDERKYPQKFKMSPAEEKRHISDIANGDPEQIEYRRAMAIFEANHTAFKVIKKELEERYKVQIEKHERYYVAIWKGIPFLVGDNRIELCFKFWKIYGKNPACFGRLGEEEEIVFSSPIA